MMRVLLVDDEKIITQGLQSIISWEELGLIICGTAYDGEEALEQAHLLQPDIIITDIRMPSINGLDLIDKLKNILPNVEIIILTGYDLFEYAQTALKKHISAYLLKPVRRDDLRETLKYAKKSIEEKLNNQIHQKEIVVLTSVARNKILSDILENQIDIADISSIWKRYILEECPLAVQVSVVEFDKKHDTDKNRMEKNEKLLEKIITNFASSSNTYIFFKYDKNYYVLITYKKANTDNTNELVDVISEIKNIILEQLNETISVGIGLLLPIDKISHSFCQAKSAVKSKFFGGENLIINYFPNKCKQDIHTASYLRLRTQELIDEIEYGKEAKAKHIICDNLDYLLSLHRQKANGFYFDCLNILLILRQTLKPELLEDTDLDTITTELPTYLESFKTFEELRKMFCNLIEKMCDNANKTIYSQRGRLIEAIKKYIDENYSITTRSHVAEKFNINPSYLSQCFKLETGIGFTNYVTEIRIQQAKKLLRSNKKIQVIAEEVGYYSAQHFSKNFRHYIGMSPDSYRKKIKN